MTLVNKKKQHNDCTPVILKCLSSVQIPSASIEDFIAFTNSPALLNPRRPNFESLHAFDWLNHPYCGLYYAKYLSQTIMNMVSLDSEVRSNAFSNEGFSYIFHQGSVANSK